MRNLLAIWALATAVSWAAIPAGTRWEVRTTGSDTNGGGYSSGGTDMSQFDHRNAPSCTNCSTSTSNLSTADASTTTASPYTLTSAGAAFTTAVTGNLVYLSGGTSGGVTAGWYSATYRGATQIDLDRSPGAAVTSVTMNIGGALATLPQAASNVQSGNTVWIKATATYAAAAQVNLLTAGTLALPITWNGYSSVRGDGGQATLQATSAIGILLNLAGACNKLNNLVLDGNGLASNTLRPIANGVTVDNLTLTNFTGAGINGSGQMVISRSLIVKGSSGTTAANGINITGGNWQIIASTIKDIGQGSVIVSTDSGNGVTLINDLILNSTGTSSADAIQVWSGFASVINCTIRSAQRDGIRFYSGDGLYARNNLITDVTGVAIHSLNDYTANSSSFTVDYNAFYNNISASYTGISPGAHDINLSSTPYTNAAAGNYSLNATPGAGAAVRAAGIPAAFPGVGTSAYPDIGAAQHQDSGGAAPVTRSYPILQ